MLIRTGLAAAALLLSLPGAAAADPGDVSTQVVGGTKTSTKGHPYAVFMVRAGETTPVCGGVIVAPDKILTAAHCVTIDGRPGQERPPESRKIIAGRDDITTSAGVVANIKKIVVNPKFDGISFDSAVLTLDRKLPQKPIQMAGSHDSSLYKFGKRATVLGWGDTQEDGQVSRFLLKASIPILHDNDCLKFWGDDDAGNPFYENKSMMCAAHKGGKIDACNGDSGGPFVAGGKLIGLVQAGIGCARPNHPAIYSRVSSINTWVKQQILL